MFVVLKLFKYFHKDWKNRYIQWIDSLKWHFLRSGKDFKWLPLTTTDPNHPQPEKPTRLHLYMGCWAVLDFQITLYSPANFWSIKFYI
jgi:hypothetical protein